MRTAPAASAASPLLDEATHSGSTWQVKVFPGAGEAVAFIPADGDPLATPEWAVDAELAATFADRHGQLFDVGAPVVEPRVESPEEEAARQKRNRLNAARRARARSRRYCKANRLSRLWTLTFADAVYDRRTVVASLNALARALRAQFGEAFPYLWAIEEHESGALHVHLAAGRIVALRCRSCDPDKQGKGLHQDDMRKWAPCLRCTWGHGFVLAQKFKGQKGNGRKASAAVAGYVAKYVGKDVEGCEPGEKSYDVGRGFKPGEVVFEVTGTSGEALAVVAAVYFDGGGPGFVWSSEDVEDWYGPPVRVAFW